MDSAMKVEDWYCSGCGVRGSVVTGEVAAGQENAEFSVCSKCARAICEMLRGTEGFPTRDHGKEMMMTYFCGLVVNPDLSMVLLAEVRGREGEEASLNGVSGPVPANMSPHQALLEWNRDRIPWMKSRWVKVGVITEEGGATIYLYFAVSCIINLTADQARAGDHVVVGWKHSSWVSAPQASRDLARQFQIVQDAYRSIHDSPDGPGGSVNYVEVKVRRLRPEEAVVGSYEKVSLLGFLLGSD